MLQIISIVFVLTLLTCATPCFFRRLSDRRFRYFLYFIFCTYLAANMYFTIFSRVPGSGTVLELTPFKMYEKLWNSEARDITNVNVGMRWLLEGTSPMSVLVLNIFLYYPMGYLLAVLFPKFHSRKIILIGFCASMTTEIIQYIGKMGWCDINDIIYNTLGTAIGVAVCVFQRKRC